MPRGTRRHETAFATVAAAIVLLGICVHSLARGDWNSAVWSGSIAIGIPAWLFALRAPTRCGVITRRGRPCPNITYGVLFGCGSAYGHTWTKFFARLGWNRFAAEGAPSFSSPAPALDSEWPAGHGPVSVRIQEDGKSKAIFWLAIVATTSGLLSAGTDLAGLFLSE